ncbi:MAG: hypothetical protein WAW85_00500 [Gordonia sp. (in: high G+C Gram-positive bacteria)]|uniref:peptidase MA family metallohydrolase n=1 Tax=Gordonia sp. (in: high G+C Gram-positive bacteria) TaxID=84139 RepID=UPI003BB78199
MFSAVLALTVLGGAVSGCGQDTAAPSPSSALASIFSTPPSVYEEQRAEGVGVLLDELNKVLTSGTRAQLDALIDPLADPSFIRWWREAQADLSPNAVLGAVRSNTRPTGTTDESEPDVGETTERTTGRTAGRSSSSSGAVSSSSSKPVSRGTTLVLRTMTYQLAHNSGPDRLIGGELGVKLTDAGSTDSWVSAVKLTYALGGAVVPGVDEPEIDLPGMLAFSRYTEGWKLLGDATVAPDPTAQTEESGRPAEVPPWQFGGLRAADVRTTGGQSAVLSYTGTDRTVGVVRTELPGAVSAVSDFWGRDWNRKAVVVATATPQQFAAFTRTASGSTSAAAAATVYSRIDGGTKAVVGQRIVLSPAAAQLSATGLAVVLRHELFHVATRLSTAEQAPMWLTEGVAEYVGRRGTRASVTDLAPDLAVQVAAGRLPDTWPTDAAFSVDTAEARIAYQTAWSFAAFVADTYGDDRLKQMYLAVAQGDDTKIAAALQQTLGETQDELITAWQRWLKREVR